MYFQEFPAHIPDDAEGVGELVVADASTLIRPKPSDQTYPSSVSHDVSHASGILRLGNDGYQARESIHIFFEGGHTAAHRTLDRVFYAYIDACCLQLWCDARVNYWNGDVIENVEHYGFEDGEYTLIFNVYCVLDDEREQMVDSLIEDRLSSPESNLLIVRKDSSEAGYTVYNCVDDEDDPLDVDDDYDELEEECQGGCGQPEYACTCAEMASHRAFHADPETSGSYWTA